MKGRVVDERKGDGWMKGRVMDERKGDGWMKGRVMDGWKEGLWIDVWKGDAWMDGRVVPWICVTRMRINWEFSQKIYWLSPYIFDNFVHLVTLFNYKRNNFRELKLQINDRMTTTVEEEALNRTVLQVYFLHCTLHSTSLYVDRHLIWCPEGLWSLLCF